MAIRVEFYWILQDRVQFFFVIREAAKKSSFFSGPATKASPPLELIGHIFLGRFFFEFVLEWREKVFFFSVASGHLKKTGP